MAVIIIASLLCFANVVFWIVFLEYFKSVSSTGKIIGKVREELERLVADLNRNADRDVELVEDKIKELRKLSAEADRRVSILLSEMEKASRAGELSHLLDAAPANLPSPENPAPAPRRARKAKPPASAASGRRSSGGTGPKASFASSAQGNLFVSAPGGSYAQTEGVGQDEQRALLGDVPSSEPEPRMRLIPVVTPPAYLADIPVPPKKDFNAQVQEKYAAGESVQQIATELGASIQEVRLSIELY